MVGLKLSAKQPDYQAAIRAIALDTERKIELVAQQTGQEVIDYLRSLTDVMRPPASRGGPARPAHPGGWADITSLLANGYTWRVEKIPGGWRLVLANTTEYAAHLEAHDAYFVLSGVTDPDGPVYAALRQVAAAVAPEWRVDVREQGVKRMMLVGPARSGSNEGGI
jgi:hypothetical protein